uniref:Uncharacterized protein n=1 Tax=Triticum urartu TaxID=4572 RepID=A0A8R7UWA0_TRIUA
MLSALSGITQEVHVKQLRTFSSPLLHRWPTPAARTRPGAGRHPLSSITSQQQCCE